ncbi:PP2C family serine/threonine-protein phosphatase [Nevskia sp.]|uniref:PP2C family protein-serine/threonine phosphatase n=1 Tax=Nevskia sp. TaxID=1929292 RepID=UPI0025D21FD3|nr:PP2C family serine/threonine-protein phosphatase [Nevskia sp.]
MSPALPAYVAAGRTDTGRVRGHNEDAVLVRDDIGLWVVADGLGGHAAGDYASQMIVDRLGRLRRPDSVDNFMEAIEDTLEAINAELRRTAYERGVDLIGSTVALLVHHRDYMLCGWVGDSRVYCYQDGRLRQATRDHAHGVDDDQTHVGDRPAPQPGGGVLTRAIGAEERLYVDWVLTERRPGMQFLLCSDGVNKEMTDRELEAAFRSDCMPPTLIGSIFETSLARGARDNVSAIVVRLNG